MLTEPACKWRAISFLFFIYFHTSRLGTRLRAKARPKKNVTGRSEKSKQTMKKGGLVLKGDEEKFMLHCRLALPRLARS